MVVHTFGTDWSIFFAESYLKNSSTCEMRECLALVIALVVEDFEVDARRCLDPLPKQMGNVVSVFETIGKPFRILATV